MKGGRWPVATPSTSCEGAEGERGGASIDGNRQLGHDDACVRELRSPTRRSQTTPRPATLRRPWKDRLFSSVLELGDRKDRLESPVHFRTVGSVRWDWAIDPDHFGFDWNHPPFRIRVCLEGRLHPAPTSTNVGNTDTRTRDG